MASDLRPVPESTSLRTSEPDSASTTNTERSRESSTIVANNRWLSPDTIKRAKFSVAYTLVRAVADWEAAQLDRSPAPSTAKKVAVRVAAATGYVGGVFLGAIEFAFRAGLASLLQAFALAEVINEEGTRAKSFFDYCASGATTTSRAVVFAGKQAILNLNPCATVTGPNARTAYNHVAAPNFLPSVALRAMNQSTEGGEATEEDGEEDRSVRGRPLPEVTPATERSATTERPAGAARGAGE